MWSTVYVHGREGTGTTSCNTLEADRLQYYRLAASVIAYWYSYFFRHFVSVTFHSGKEKFGALLRKVEFYLFRIT
jgi:hypothetical protein